MSRRYSKKSHFDELRKNELTSRAGFGWEEGEEEKLLLMRLDKSSYKYLLREAGAYIAHITVGRRGIQISDHLPNADIFTKVLQ